MNFKRLSLLFVGLMISAAGMAQTRTTEELHKKYSDGLSLFFYNNTLRMLNQKDDKEFDALIKDIQKMKFLMIEKGKDFNYKKLTSSYKSESFEEIMSSRIDGKRFASFRASDQIVEIAISIARPDAFDNHLRLS